MDKEALLVTMCARRKKFSYCDREWVDLIGLHTGAMAAFVKVMPPLDAIHVLATILRCCFANSHIVCLDLGFRAKAS